MLHDNATNPRGDTAMADEPFRGAPDSCYGRKKPCCRATPPDKSPPCTCQSGGCKACRRTIPEDRQRATGADSPHSSVEKTDGCSDAPDSGEGRR